MYDYVDSCRRFLHPVCVQEIPFDQLDTSVLEGLFDFVAIQRQLLARRGNLL